MKDSQSRSGSTRDFRQSNETQLFIRTIEALWLGFQTISPFSNLTRQPPMPSLLKS